MSWLDYIIKVIKGYISLVRENGWQQLLVDLQNKKTNLTDLLSLSLYTTAFYIVYILFSSIRFFTFSSFSMQVDGSISSAE